VKDFGLAGERWKLFELGFDAGSIANQEKPRIRVADQRNRSPWNDHARSVVPAHGVERYGDWRSHTMCR